MNFLVFTAGTFVMNTFISTGTYLDVQFEGFSSKLDILMYYVTLSNNSDANNTNCKNYVSKNKSYWIIQN